MAPYNSSRDNDQNAVDEVTPLLLAAEAGQPAGAIDDSPQSSCATGNGNLEQQQQQQSANEEFPDEDTDAEKPLPALQIFLLCWARMVEPMAFFCIFPFIPQMIRETGVPETDLGFYSGLIESLFSVTQTILMLGWGRAADRLGRKPVLVFSLTGMSVCTAMFGFSRNLWQMMVLRCMAGMFGGTLVTIRTMFSENSTPKTHARAFSFFAFSGNMGIFLGPVIGGVFAEPAKNLSSTFGRIPLFQRFPYALPTLMTGALALSAAIFSSIWIRETYDRKAAHKNHPKRKVSITDLLRTKGIAMTLYLYTHVMMLGMAYTAVMPVFYYTSIKLGGWGLTTRQSSMFMAGVGLMQAVWLLFVFPPIQLRIGTAGVLRVCAYAWPFTFIVYPSFNMLLRHGWTNVFWIAAPPTVALVIGVAMAFTAVQLAVNEISPSPAALATLNALALTMSSAIRAITPGLFASLFATGVRTQILSGYLVWAVLIVNTFIVIFAMQYLPDGISRGRQGRKA